MPLIQWLTGGGNAPGVALAASPSASSSLVATLSVEVVADELIERRRRSSGPTVVVIEVTAMLVMDISITAALDMTIDVTAELAA